MTAQRAIGGFFELELSGTGTFPHQNGQRYRSARTAFAALLQARRPARVWMPRYLCDSMLLPLLAANIPYAWYDLTDGLDIPRDIALADDDIIVYVNYFGILDGNVPGILADFGPANLVLDYSQALYSPPQDCLATIYSFRKFVGVPDGGALHATLAVAPAAPGVAGGVSHLVGRLIDGPEPHYGEYVANESSFDDLTVTGMSPLATRVLQSIDWDRARNARATNFAALHTVLHDSNRFPVAFPAGAAPLCYPYLTPDATELRAALAAQRVYTPVYWKDALARSGAGSLEARLVNQLVAIPCDQRYTVDDMQYVASLIKSIA